MSSETTKMFRTQMGGFNRDDVNNYIKETDLKHSEEISALRSQLDEIESKVNDLATQCIDLEEVSNSLISEKEAALKRADEAIEALSEKDKLIAELEKKADFYKSEAEAQINVMNELKIETKRLAAELESANNADTDSTADEIARLTALNEEKDAIIVSLNDEIERVNAENIALAESSKNAIANSRMGDITDTTSNAYKLDTYNKISAQLGDILINANRNADEIVSTARENANQILMEAELEGAKKKEDAILEAMSLREKIELISDEVVLAVNEDLTGSIEGCMKEISTCIDDMKYEIQTMMTKLSTRSDEINQKLSYYRANAAESVSKKVADMEFEYTNLLSDNSGDENND
ncbi:MAG: hypothetical protein E7627_02245 [Ruminococcaceae bacterium]|nr:hypothetical protein [Oscillospiraceae bacterium]